MRTVRALGMAALVAALAWPPLPARAQQPTEVALTGPGGAQGVAIPLGYQRGYAAFPIGALRRIGWSVTASADAAAGAASRGEDHLAFRERSPFFQWGDDVLQLTAEPYRYGDDLWVPLQLLPDFLVPRHKDELAFHDDGPSLEVKDPAAWTPETAARLSRASVAPAEVKAPPAALPSPTRPAPSAPKAAAPAKPEANPRARVVVIDAGHGGEDPGAHGPTGVREKDVALKLALALARELKKDPDLDVHLTRNTDRLVPLWERGEWATGVKGERPGVFISLHANAETSRAASGFETYFLSEARTEHEKRVAALENEPFTHGPAAGAAAPADPELNGIVKELRNLDDEHWSSLLAELVQDELAKVHPGPNRGVKQGPLAVITNSLMPAVLVEVGFISNRDEERLLDSSIFETAAAHAIASAVESFFERYPPGAVPPSGVGK